MGVQVCWQGAGLLAACQQQAQAQTASHAGANHRGAAPTFRQLAPQPRVVEALEGQEGGGRQAGVSHSSQQQPAAARRG